MATTTRRTAKPTARDHTLHTTVCRRPVAITWADRCTCTHLAVTHASADHTAIAVPAGSCTGRNLAGPCLQPGCDCHTYTRPGGLR